MLLQFIQILYVLVAIAIIAFVLLQQGAGASAGSGFGGGASATVFGARGASNFLSKSTKWLAITFFVISMGMAMYASRQANRQGPAKADLGVMAEQAPAQPAAQVPTAQVPTAAAQPPAAETQPAQPAPAPGQ
jgi:preprotein translocase subunit SecG